MIGDNPSDLSPRRSFAQWHQLVEGTSEPWTPADIAAARLIGQSVADIVLQFRAVRTLIAQDQLEQFSRHVRVSEQPVIIADIDGKILLMNEAFKTLLPRDHAAARLDDLASAFQQPEGFLHSVRELVGHHRAWRGELSLRDEGNREKPLMVRADPVQPSRDRVLGFVLIFSDITDRKAAEIAQPFPGGHSSEQSDQQRPSGFQDRPCLSESAVVRGRERPAGGARDYLWRGNRPYRRDARERTKFDAANRRGAGAFDLAFVAHIRRRQDREIAPSPAAITYSAAVTGVNPRCTVDCTAHDRAMLCEKAMAPSSTTSWKSETSAPA